MLLSFLDDVTGLSVQLSVLATFLQSSTLSDSELYTMCLHPSLFLFVSSTCAVKNFSSSL